MSIEENVKKRVQRNQARLAGIDIVSYPVIHSGLRSKGGRSVRKPQNDPQPIPNAIKATSLHYWAEED